MDIIPISNKLELYTSPNSRVDYSGTTCFTAADRIAASSTAADIEYPSTIYEHGNHPDWSRSSWPGCF